MNRELLQRLIQDISPLTINNEDIMTITKTAFKNNLDSVRDVIKEIRINATNQLADESITNLIVSIIENTFKEELIDHKSHIQIIEGIEIDTRVINFNALEELYTKTGFNNHSQKYLSSLAYLEVAERDLSQHIMDMFGPITVPTELWLSTKGTTYIQYKKNVTKEILYNIRVKNQYINIRYTSNPFRETSLSFNKGIMTMNDQNLFNKVPKAVYNDILLRDYKEQYKDLDNMLDFILAAKFGADTKKSYLHLQAPSNWGKSFLFEGVLGQAGLDLSATLTESELKMAYTGGASGLSVAQFRNKWFIFFEEFGAAVKELKNITHNIEFTPKFGTKVSVPVFAKIAVSAELPESLVSDGVIDKQFSNRFSLLKASDVLLTDRVLYADNTKEYLEVITTYVYEYLVKESNIYIELGETKASNRANTIQNEFIKEFKLETTSIEEYLADLLPTFWNEIDDASLHPYIQNYVHTDAKGNVYITNRKKILNEFLDTMVDTKHKEVSIMKKGISVALGLDPISAKQVKIQGQTKSNCYLVRFTSITGLKKSSTDFDFSGIK